jgi:hypothetical protein
LPYKDHEKQKAAQRRYFWRNRERMLSDQKAQYYAKREAGMAYRLVNGKRTLVETREGKT